MIKKPTYARDLLLKIIEFKIFIYIRYIDLKDLDREEKDISNRWC